MAETQTLVVEAGGVMARYRDRNLDGTLIEGDWHEIKLGLVGAWQDGQLVDSSYVAARETAASFAPRLGTESARRGALDIVGWRGLDTDGGGQEAILRRVVVLGDGAKWIWEHVASSFGSERIEILDWIHCCQHLLVVGDAVHGAGSSQAAAWVAHAKEVIWQEGPDALLHLLASCRATSEEATKILETELGYFRGERAGPMYDRRRMSAGAQVVSCRHEHLVGCPEIVGLRQSEVHLVARACQVGS